MTTQLPALFFEVFYERSGSTYLADVLTRHPDISVAPEANFLERVVRGLNGNDVVLTSGTELSGLLDIIYGDPKFATWELKRLETDRHLSARLPLPISALIREIIYLSCQSRYNKTSKWCGYKKGGWYAKHASILRTFFPEARFIHIVRDGRAAYASAKKAVNSLTGKPFVDDPVMAALAWREAIRDFDRIRRRPYAIEIYYEELMLKPQDTLKRVLDFLETDFNDSMIQMMLEPHRPLFIVKPQSHLHKKVGQAPDVSRILSWQTEVPEDEIRVYEEIAGLELYEKGYWLLHLHETQLVVLFLRKYWQKVKAKFHSLVGLVRKIKLFQKIRNAVFRVFLKDLIV